MKFPSRLIIDTIDRFKCEDYDCVDLTVRKTDTEDPHQVLTITFLKEDDEE